MRSFRIFCRAFSHRNTGLCEQIFFILGDTMGYTVNIRAASCCILKAIFISNTGLADFSVQTRTVYNTYIK